MKVVYVCSLERFGPLTHLLDLAPAVGKTGPDVLVACANDEIAREFQARGVDALALPLGHKFDVQGAKRLWPSLRGADVVHTHDRRAGLIARPLARVAGAAAVHTLQACRTRSSVSWAVRTDGSSQARRGLERRGSSMALSGSKRRWRGSGRPWCPPRLCGDFSLRTVSGVENGRYSFRRRTPET